MEPPPEPQHEPPFLLEVAVSTNGDARDMYIVVHCTRCLWETDWPAPAALTEVNFRVDEHKQRCNPG